MFLLQSQVRSTFGAGKKSAPWLLLCTVLLKHRRTLRTAWSGWSSESVTSPTSSLNQPVLELTVDAACVCFLPKQISPTLGNSFNHNAFGFSSLSFPLPLHPAPPPRLPSSLFLSLSFLVSSPSSLVRLRPVKQAGKRQGHP